MMLWYTRDVYKHVCEVAHICYLIDYTHVQCSRCNIIMIRVLDNIRVYVIRQLRTDYQPSDRFNCPDRFKTI